MASRIPSKVALLVPIVDIDDAPVLSAAEKDELIASLEAAEAEIARGEGSVFASGELLAEYREHLARQQVS